MIAALAPLAWFIDPYRSGFMQRALIGVFLIGTFVPAVGVWIVLRRLSYLGDAMGHGLLAGVAGAYLAGWSITVGALIAGLAMAFIIAGLSRFPKLREDSAIGVAETILFSVGLILIARKSSRIGIDLSHFLFGQIATTSVGDLRLNALLVAVGIALMALFFHDLRVATFDPIHAKLVGIRVGALSTGLLVLLALAVVISLQTVGLLMSVAMLVSPATAARVLTDRLPLTIALASSIGVASGFTGLTLAYHLSAPPGATIALVAAGVLLVVLVGKALSDFSARTVVG